MEPTNKLVWCLLLLVPIVVSLPIDDKASDDYLPRSIKTDEGSVPETAPTTPPPPSQDMLPPPAYASNIKPVEFQYFVPLEVSPAATGDSPNYNTYEIVVEGQKPEGEEGAEDSRTQYENDYVDDNAEGNAPSTRDNDGRPDSYLPDYEALLRQYFGPKSKYFYDKDEVGVVGKASRFRRDAGDAASTSYAYSQSSSTGGSPNHFGNTGFGQFDSGFGQSGFGNGAFRSGFEGGLADVGTGFGYNAGYQSQGAGFGSNLGSGGQYGNTGYHSATAYSDDGGNGGGILTRSGFNDEGAAPQGGGTASRGVFAESASSIDSSGKSTHYVNSGRL